MKSVCSIFRMVPMILLMGTIFFLSHQPGNELQLPNVPYLDKVCHFAIYGLLALSALYAFSSFTRYGSVRGLYFAVLIFCFLYGLSDEYHQSFIAGRDSSVADLMADFLGALLFLLFLGSWVLEWNSTGISPRFFRNR